MVGLSIKTGFPVDSFHYNTGIDNLSCYEHCSIFAHHEDFAFLGDISL